MPIRSLALAIALFAVLVSPLWAAPPEIVSVYPDNGDLVDPALKELRIEFDQDMGGGRSICGGGPLMPKMAGNPVWETARVLVVPIELEPSHDYTLSINCPSFQNFRSAAGEPVTPYPVSFRTAADSGSAAKPAALSAKDNEAAVAALRRAIDEHYSYRDLRDVKWEELLTERAERLADAKTPAAFARQVASLLSAARDVHISVKVGNATLPTFRPGVAANCNVRALGKLVPRWTKRSNEVASGRFDDGTGYLLIASWPSTPSLVLEPALAALREMADAPALIIDVRPNGGGDESIAQQVAGRFIDKPVLYSKNSYRKGGAPGAFTEVIDRNLAPGPAAERYKGKVVVLMGPANMSSNESFLLMMKAAGATLVGERSYGSSGNPRPHDLGNGVTVFLPSWKDMLPDGTVLEGRGVEPDVPVRTTPQELESADPVLEAARQRLK